ncbi:MAG: hypothetical protein WBA57_07140 [Elainellaceae cyanobacterium]
MTEILIRSPSFYYAQRVSFLGGEGIVQSYKYEAETWTYIVKMALGPEPQFGRIGSETSVFLDEADLYAA